jgi:hypothetical protein
MVGFDWVSPLPLKKHAIHELSGAERAKAKARRLMGVNVFGFEMSVLKNMRHLREILSYVEFAP